MNPNELYACVLVREFPAQAITRLRPELRSVPCVILEGKAPLQTVCSLNTKARLLGLQHGMTKAELETFGDVTTVERSEAAERSMRDALTACAGTFSPRLECLQDATTFLCCIDIAGTQALFGLPGELARSLRSRAATLGVSVQIAVSSSYHASILLARGLAPRYGVRVVPHGEERSALAELPLSVFSLADRHAETLALWGIRSAGMLAALPQSQLVSRLGQEGKRLQQLATGTLPHLFQPIEVPFVLQEHADLDHPLDNLESLLFGLRIMLEQLVLRAAMRMYVLSSVTITLELEGGAQHVRTVSPRVPSDDKHLWLKLLQLDLEAHPAPAAIVAVHLQAEPGITGKVQLGLFSPQLPEPGRLDVTLARIAAMVGEDNVGRAVLDDTHRLHNFHTEPFTVPSATAEASPVPASHTCMRRVTPPEAVAVHVRNHCPAQLRARGRIFTVEHAYGPWQAGGEWWTDKPWEHEQWDVIARCQAGSLLYCCVVRAVSTSQWSLVGLYD